MRKLSAYGPSLIVLVTAIVVLVAGPLAVRRITFAQTRARIIQASDRLANSNILEQINQSYRDIAEMVEPSVVHISAEQLVRASRFEDPSRALSSGSGWVYDEQGHIVTNFHVVQDAERIQVQLHTGELREAALVGFDQFTDVAVVKIKPGLLHPAARAPRDRHLHQGDMVFAFGSPFDFRFSMSSGVVSGMGRSVGVIRDPRARWRGYENFIQVDAAINPGNSGGPLTDYRGHVIGMNTAIATSRSGALDEGQFAGIGLAIPIDMVESAVDQLIKTGEVAKGYLGVTTGDVVEEVARRFQQLGFVGYGVVITEVRADGPAGVAGVQVGDIVTHVNGTAVASVDQLRSVVSSMPPGETAQLRIWRFDEISNAGTTVSLPVKLTRLDLAAQGFVPISERASTARRLGLAEITNNTPALASEHGAANVPGVLVLALVHDTPAADSIPPGSVITAVNDRPITSVDQFFNVLNDSDFTRRGIRIVLVRPDGTQIIGSLSFDRDR
jgi:S1-C subfamily serine protease